MITCFRVPLKAVNIHVVKPRTAIGPIKQATGVRSRRNAKKYYAKDNRDKPKDRPAKTHRDRAGSC